MASKEKHSRCPVHNDSETRIWRYSNFAKFVSMLESRSLYFTRSDLLQDKFEGAKTVATVLERFKRHQDARSHALELGEYAKLRRMCVFINCWHMNEHESAAMWKVYGDSVVNQAIVIQSTVGRLDAVTDTDVVLGVVDYVNYGLLAEQGGAILEPSSDFAPFFMKRKSFAHEQELRAMISEYPTQGPEESLPQALLKAAEIGELKSGIRKSVDLNLLIERVLVCPAAENWFYNLVKEVSSKYGVTARVEQSEMDIGPLF